VTADLYGDVAPREALLRAALPPNERKFYRRILGDEPVLRLLDCACGAGLELAFLRSLGHDAVGSDRSPAMLAAARAELERAGVTAPLHELDYRALPDRFGPEFDAVLCTGASLVHVSDDEDALRALRSMHGVLAPGGFLILDQGITDARWRAKPRFTLAADLEACTRLYAIDYLGERAARYHALDVVRGPQGAALRVWSTDLHVLLREQQERLLRAAGFGTLEFFGSFELEPYDASRSRRLIAVARR
jgi:SAM-dependent methyltransferase